ncbi:hypothetical protein SEPCBS119000_004458 [Sporothrix epigloea]|uniref:Glucosidase 2 subunit beta n=1 Tax=Sporothrix epigloea TaxID=1892477 RepID=A0ABP0DSD1_9PEZI
MRQTGPLLLAGVLASSVAASTPRGVGPEFARYYASTDRFTCISNPTVVLDFAQVNDGSCDCPDGSDEPGTSACAYLDPLSPAQPLPGSPSGSTKTKPLLPGFWCDNAGHIGAYVPFSHVNDGICDYEQCCDGSEEFAHKNGVKCPNRCAAIGKEYRRVEEERLKGQERALKRRRVLAKEATKLRNQIQERIAQTRSEISGLERTCDRLQKELADTERAERGRVVKTGGSGAKAGGKLGLLVVLAKQRVTELRETLEKVLDHRDDLQDKVDELETILRKFKEQYNPNFNDDGVKAAVHAWEDYAAKAAAQKSSAPPEVDTYAVLKEDSEKTGINWAAFETEDETETDVLYSFEAYLPQSVRAFIYEKLAALRVWMVENGLLADNGDTVKESQAVKNARAALHKAENNLSTRRNALVEDESDLNKDYGADDIFRALKDKCISTAAGEYDYEFCWLSQATQKSKKGHGNTSLGRLDRADTETADEEERPDGKSLGKGPRTVLRYENGQQCWNGPNRRTDVWLGCAEQEEIWRVSETEKCVYKMEVGTPAVCEDNRKAVDTGKDEL